MPREHTCTYRGYLWECGDREVIVTCLARPWFPSTFEVVVRIDWSWSEESLSLQALEAIVHELWTTVTIHRKIRDSAIHGSSGLAAVDLIPWEIHEIVDETAYQAALTGFKHARG